MKKKKILTFTVFQFFSGISGSTVAKPDNSWKRSFNIGGASISSFTSHRMISLLAHQIRAQTAMTLRWTSRLCFHEFAPTAMTPPRCSARRGSRWNWFGSFFKKTGTPRPWLHMCAPTAKTGYGTPCLLPTWRCSRGISLKIFFGAIRTPHPWWVQPRKGLTSLSAVRLEGASRSVVRLRTSLAWRFGFTRDSVLPIRRSQEVNDGVFNPWFEVVCKWLKKFWYIIWK